MNCELWNQFGVIENIRASVINTLSNTIKPGIFVSWNQTNNLSISDSLRNGPNKFYWLFFMRRLILRICAKFVKKIRVFGHNEVPNELYCFYCLYTKRNYYINGLLFKYFKKKSVYSLIAYTIFIVPQEIYWRKRSKNLLSHFRSCSLSSPRVRWGRIRLLTT